MKEYDLITFKDTGKVIIPDKSLPKYFLISRQILMQDAIEVHPFSLTILVKAFISNSLYKLFWRWIRFEWKYGRVTTEQGMIFAMKDYRPYKKILDWYLVIKRWWRSLIDKTKPPYHKDMRVTKGGSNEL